MGITARRLIVLILSAAWLAAGVSADAKARWHRAALKKVDLAQQKPAAGGATRQDKRLVTTTATIRYESASEGEITLQDLRGQLALDPSAVFARLEANGTCVTPLSSHQESFTRLDETTVLLSVYESRESRALLAAYLDPPAHGIQWNPVRPEPVGEILAADAPSHVFCPRWLKQVHLLSQLWEKRKYFLGDGPSYDIESRMVEALRYFGWRAAKTLDKALVPLTHETKPWDGEVAGGGDAGGSEIQSWVWTFLVNRPPPVLTKPDELHKALRKVSQTLDCPDLLEAFPRERWTKDLRLEGRETKLQMFVLLASFDPLVVFANHHHGHVAIFNDNGTLHSTRTFAQLDEDMARTRGVDGFFAAVVWPQYVVISTQWTPPPSFSLPLSLFR